MKLMILLLISLLLATGVEAGSEKKCKKCTKKFNQCVKKSCPSPPPAPPPPAAPSSPPAQPPPPPGPTKAAGTFTSKDSLMKAVTAFNKKPAKAEKKYGPIAGWDVSGITDMSYLFSETKFDADISNWNTSGVTSMYRMFMVRSAARALPPHSPPVAGCPRARPLRPLLPHAL